MEYAATYRRLALDFMRSALASWPWSTRTVRGPDVCLARRRRRSQDYFERARSRLDAQGLTHLRAIVDYDQALLLIRAGVTDRARIVALLDAALDASARTGCWLGRACRRAEGGADNHASRSGASADRQYPAGLTAREAEVLRLVAAGLTNKEIAAELVLSVPTVERHVANIYGKIGASRRYEALAFAQKHGLGPAAGD